MEIKRISVSNVAPGMRVAENVYNSVNQLIVPKDAVLTDKAIARMRFHAILSIRVYEGVDEEPSAPAPTPIGNELSYFEKLRETDEFIAYQKCFNECVGLFDEKLQKMLREGCEPDNDALVGSVQDMRSSCRTGIQVFDLLHCMRDYDDITFAHSINVSLICAVFGSWLGYNENEIDVLMQCGIYHDIGKLKIPKKIAEKPSALTSEEFKLVKTHTTEGYNILRDKKLDTRVKLCAMMHHERCDGSGYPLGLKAEQIDDFAKILMIADVYEAMTSKRVYRKGICPFEVIRMFETEGLAQYDPKFLMTFMENITQSYLGNRVRLNDGTTGTIIFINKLAYSKPMIQVDDSTYIDLTKKPSLLIDAIL